MARGYLLTVRAAGRTVQRERFDTLEGALDALQARGLGFAEAPSTGTVSAPLMRDFDPVQQVRARLELKGPGRVRAGVDVRGDGSAEAYTGRVRRRLVQLAPGESAWSGLRRVLDP
ncbi:MAG: hypothetical protein H0V29_04255 [Thermoleophilaceae bacterium]|nr:hypothetical protein [Thermoleophilaceae bacterium]